MTTRGARVARGWIAATVSLFVAGCSHALAGGGLPATAGLALCLVFSTLVCILLAGKSLSLARLSIAVALSQLLFHGFFSLLTDARLSISELAGVGMHHGSNSVFLQLASGTPGAASLGHSTMSASMTTDADLRMWAGHAIGALVTIAALGYGESVFWGLLQRARLCISRILGVVLPVETLGGERLARIDRPAAVVARTLQFSIHRHRGPPVLAATL